jgi:hypothetical protein
LHWYRSTLAHNAPLFDGRSQPRARGVLRAYEERGGAGWIDAGLPSGALASGVVASRALVVMTDYAIEQLRWESARDVRVELPIHAPGRLQGVSAWQTAPLSGGTSLDDGFSFVRDAETSCAPDTGVAHLMLNGDTGGQAWILTAPDARWWRATAPGPPGTGDRPFHLVRCDARTGAITTVWSWGGAIAGVERDGDTIRVRRSAGEVHQHSRGEGEWQVALIAGSARSTIILGGATDAPPNADVAAAWHELPPAPRAISISPVPRAFTARLGREHYRRSEPSWEEAGSPRADVSIGIESAHLVITVEVRKRDVVFRSANAPDPALDNEHPDIHSDGVQLYLLTPEWSAMAAWLAVPERESGLVRLRAVDGSYVGVPIAASWQERDGGYALSFRLPLSALGEAPVLPVWLDVLVNDMAPDRQRRRGQLALSGGHGGYVYLQGDRQSPHRLLPFLIARA